MTGTEFVDLVLNRTLKDKIQHLLEAVSERDFTIVTIIIVGIDAVIKKQVRLSVLCVAQF